MKMLACWFISELNYLFGQIDNKQTLVNVMSKLHE